MSDKAEDMGKAFSPDRIEVTKRERVVDGVQQVREWTRTSEARTAALVKARDGQVMLSVGAPSCIEQGVALSFSDMRSISLTPAEAVHLAGLLATAATETRS
ncbi:MAG: hypothetical protein ACYDD1_05145 [Caulobacteraceae bacterium]